MRPTSWIHRVTAVAAAVAVLSCSADSTSPTVQPATGFTLVDGDGQTGEVYVALARPVLIKVSDGTGTGVPGVIVSFAVTAGGGRVAAAEVATNSRGLASVVWTLGSVIGPGTQGLAVTSAALPGSTITLTASSTVSKGTQVIAVAGDGQQGEVATLLPGEPTVVVRNAMGEPVVGAPVRWSVVSGAGKADPVESVTDETGRASTKWTLGPVVGVGAHKLAATVSPTGRATMTASGVLTAGAVTLVSGDRQLGFTDSPLWQPLVVRVTTPGPNGVGVAGVVVVWGTGAGSGSVKSASTTTTIDGIASVDWTLGAATGDAGQSVTASVSGLGGSPLTFLATARPAPASIVKVSGDGQTAVVKSSLAQPFVVRVLDAGGQPVAGAKVQWKHTYTDGVFISQSTDTRITNDDGLSSINITLRGEYAGANAETMEARVTAPALECCSATFHASVLPGPAHFIWLLDGDAQLGTVGMPLAAPIVVMVTDAYWNPVAGVTVDWTPATGSGSTTSSSSVTDGQGLASVGWTLGPTVGTGSQSVRATVNGLQGSPVTFTAWASAGP